jgi:anti-sigma B factor antagonist
MALRIIRRDYGDITVLELDGGMTMVNLPNPPLFRDTIDDLIRSQRNKIVLLYEGVPYQDSTGNGEIVRAFTKVRNAGGTLVFVGLTQKINDLFQITKLITVFPVFKTLDEALSHLGYSQDGV